MLNLGRVQRIKRSERKGDEMKAITVEPMKPEAVRFEEVPEPDISE